MGPLETFRTALVAALREATRGYSDLYVTGVLSLRAEQLHGLSDASAVADWTYLLGGTDGTGGLVGEAKLAMGNEASTAERRAAWRRVYELGAGFLQVLRELPPEPAKSSCAACEAFGCSACDQSGLTFDQPEAA